MWTFWVFTMLFFYFDREKWKFKKFNSRPFWIWIPNTFNYICPHIKFNKYEKLNQWWTIILSMKFSYRTATGWSLKLINLGINGDKIITYPPQCEMFEKVAFFLPNKTQFLYGLVLAMKLGRGRLQHLFESLCLSPWWVFHPITLVLL